MGAQKQSYLGLRGAATPGRWAALRDGSNAAAPGHRRALCGRGEGGARRRRHRKWRQGCARMAAVAAMTAAGGGGAGAARSLSRFRGCLAGALLGDCVGAIYEAHDTVSLTSVLHHVQSLEPDPGTPGSARTGGRGRREWAGPAGVGGRARWACVRRDRAAGGHLRLNAARFARVSPLPLPAPPCRPGRASFLRAPRRRPSGAPQPTLHTAGSASPRATRPPPRETSARPTWHALACVSRGFLVVLSLFGSAHTMLPLPRLAKAISPSECNHLE